MKHNRIKKSPFYKDSLDSGGLLVTWTGGWRTGQLQSPSPLGGSLSQKILSWRSGYWSPPPPAQWRLPTLASLVRPPAGSLVTVVTMHSVVTSDHTIYPAPPSPGPGPRAAITPRPQCPRLVFTVLLSSYNNRSNIQHSSFYNFHYQTSPLPSHLAHSRGCSDFSTSAWQFWHRCNIVFLIFEEGLTRAFI